MTEVVNFIINYQKDKGKEFDPQLIIFTLSGCPVCKNLLTDLMIDGYAYEDFNCNKDEHSDIADLLEDQLNTNRYPIILITYPEPKLITMDHINTEIPLYPQITEHLT